MCRNDEFCIFNDEFCIKNDEFCIKNDEFCIKNDEFCVTNDVYSVRTDGGAGEGGLPAVRLRRTERGRAVMIASGDRTENSSASIMSYSSK